MASRPLMMGSMTKEQPDWMKLSAAISDDHQIFCFALALWNGKDPILKERLFGLTNSEGNHGGTSRSITLSGQHANALLHEVPLQVPAGSISVCGSHRDQPS